MTSAKWLLITFAGMHEHSILIKKISKPLDGEFPAYAIMYLDLVPDDGFLLQHLEDNFEHTKKLVLGLPQEKWMFRYAPGKWTVKELLVHIIDDERIYAYRALRFARNDQTELPGFEQDDYAVHSGANDRSIESIIEEYDAVRKATITLFDNFPAESLLRSGMANGNKVSVRALGYHIAGHELHHVNILKTRYLG